VTIASSISRADSRCWSGRLSDMHEGISEIGFDNPVLIGVGEVFGQARVNEKFDRQPIASAG
ncbi:MAG: uroporphyrinogen-III C-methyltransferase, partial [Pseudomonadota bacterium]